MRKPPYKMKISPTYKFALLCLLSILFVSCARTTPEPATQPTPVAPVQTLPPTVDAPSRAEVDRKVKVVSEANDRLKEKVAKSEVENKNLTQALKEIEESETITREQVQEVREASEKLGDKIKDLSTLVTWQRNKINEVDEELDRSQEQVTKLIQERNSLRESLKTANRNLERLVRENTQIKREGDDARLNEREQETRTLEEEKKKKKYFWWMIAGWVLFLGSIALQIYMTFNKGMRFFTRF